MVRKSSKLLKIKDVDYLGKYHLKLWFNDGVVKDCDLEPYLNGPVFEPLRDLHEFIQYGLTCRTIEWANGADFAPEFFYEIGKTVPYSRPKLIDIIYK